MQIEKDHWIAAGVIAGLFLVFGLGVWWPEQSKLSGYKQRIAEAEEQLGPTFHQPAAIVQGEEKNSELREKIENSSRYVPEQAGLASVLRSLSQSLQSQGVSEQAVMTQEPREFKHYNEVPIELEFEGDFESVYSVLDEIETMPRLARMDALSLRVLPAREDLVTKPRVKATYRLSSFFTGGQEEGS